MDASPADGFLAESSTAAALNPPEELGGEKSAYGHRGDLKRDAGDDNVVANLQQFLVVPCSCGDTATNCLQDKRSDVATDENPGEKPGIQARMFRTECEDDVFQGKVDTGGDKSRGENEADDLELECV